MLKIDVPPARKELDALLHLATSRQREQISHSDLHKSSDLRLLFIGAPRDILLQSDIVLEC